MGLLQVGLQFRFYFSHFRGEGHEIPFKVGSHGLRIGAHGPRVCFNARQPFVNAGESRIGVRPKFSDFSVRLFQPLVRSIQSRIGAVNFFPNRDENLRNKVSGFVILFAHTLLRWLIVP